jgi:hypothetical protein
VDEGALHTLPISRPPFRDCRQMSSTSR